VASQKVASQKVASQKVASQKVASQKVASQKVASQKVASQKVASQEVAINDQKRQVPVHFGDQKPLREKRRKVDAIPTTRRTRSGGTKGGGKEKQVIENREVVSQDVVSQVASNEEEGEHNIFADDEAEDEAEDDEDDSQDAINEQLALQLESGTSQRVYNEENRQESNEDTKFVYYEEDDPYETQSEGGTYTVYKYDFTPTDCAISSDDVSLSEEGDEWDRKERVENEEKEERRVREERQKIAKKEEKERQRALRVPFIPTQETEDQFNLMFIAFTRMKRDDGALRRRRKTGVLHEGVPHGGPLDLGFNIDDFEAEVQLAFNAKDASIFLHYWELEDKQSESEDSRGIKLSYEKITKDLSPTTSRKAMLVKRRSVRAEAEKRKAVKKAKKRRKERREDKRE
jgi:hypothetical protein